MEARVLLNSTPSLVSYPRLAFDGTTVLGQASATPNSRVGSPAVPMPTAYATTNTTRDTIDVATSAAVEGATEITVASAAWVRGRSYLIVGTDGHIQEVVSRKTVTGTTLYLKEPLLAAVPVNSAVKGWAVIRALTAAETALVGDGEIMWKAVVGDAYEWITTFRICRRLPFVCLSPTVLTQLYPSVKTMRSRQDHTLHELIETTWEFRLLAWLLKHNIDPEDVIASEALVPLHAIMCLHQICLDNKQISTELFDRVEKVLEKESNETLARKDWFDAEQDETPAMRPEENDGAGRAAVRLSR